MYTKLEEIIKSDMYMRIVETGCGCPVASELLSISGASNTIFDCSVPYGKETQNKYLKDGQRSVSVDFVSNIINTLYDHPKCNTIFASSFQVGPDKCSHGWIGVRYKDYIRYYHITFPKGVSRALAIKSLGDIGVSVLLMALGQKVETNMFIDNILDEKENVVFEELFRPFDRGSYLVDKENVFRLEVYRDLSTLYIYPGSFNPIHEGHEEILRITTDIAEKRKNWALVPSIALNNIESSKRKDIGNIKERIDSLNELGYPVIVNSSGRFKDFLLLADRLDCTISLSIGWDTFQRIEKELFHDKRLEWIIFDRENTFKELKNYVPSPNKGTTRNILKLMDNHPRITMVDYNEHQFLSSTKIKEDGNTQYN